MSHHGSLTLLRGIAVLLLVCILIPSAYSYDLTVRVSDTTVTAGATQGWISVYVANPVDVVAGYSLWLQLDRPDLIRLDAPVDTVGTLTSGFEFVSAASLGGIWTDLKITALAETDPLQNPPNPGFGPSTTERRLLRVPFHLLAVPDTMTDRTVVVRIQYQLADAFNFARPDGTLIGISFEERPDSTFYRCMSWSGDQCLAWQKVAGPPWDSLAVTIDTIPFVDTSVVNITVGQVTIAPCTRTIGDIDIDGNGLVLTVADYVALVRYIVGDTSGIANPFAADVDGNCVIDWADANKLDTLMNNPLLCDPAPCRLPCACDHTPVRVCCWQNRGNVNGDINHVVDLVDLSMLVTYLTATVKPSLLCPDEANINATGIIDLSDLSFLIAYLTAIPRPTLPNCP